MISVLSIWSASVKCASRRRAGARSTSLIGAPLRTTPTSIKWRCFGDCLKGTSRSCCRYYASVRRCYPGLGFTPPQTACRRCTRCCVCQQSGRALIFNLICSDQRFSSSLFYSTSLKTPDSIGKTASVMVCQSQQDCQCATISAPALISWGLVNFQ